MPNANEHDSTPPTTSGAWVAVNWDDSGAALFATEVEALRYATTCGMRVTFWPFGKELAEVNR